jgi:hypothetical protein
MKKWCTLLSLFVGTLSLHAQNLTGSWYGIGKVESELNEGNTYLSELNIAQDGKTITGQLNFYFRDSLFSNTLIGTYDHSTRSLVFKPSKIIYYKSSNTLSGVDCEVEAYFNLRISRVESVLTGGFYATNNFKYTCPTINFKLKKHKAEAIEETETPLNEEETNNELAIKKDSVFSEVASSSFISNKEEIEKQTVFKSREKIFAKEIIIENKTLQLEFYDNGAIDNDSISVFLNNQLVLSKTKLEHKPIQLTINYNDSLPYNELSMFAESLGLIPPNTSALIIFDGKKRYEVLMTSDFNKNGTIKLTRKKENYL